MRKTNSSAPRSRLDRDIAAYRRDGGTIEPPTPPSTQAPVRAASETLAELGRRTLEEARAARAAELKSEAAALQRLGSPRIAAGDFCLIETAAGPRPADWRPGQYIKGK